MQEIQQSIIAVTGASGFYWYVSVIITIGMLAGSKFDHRLTGFIKSISLIAPYALILLFTTGSRLYETSLIRPLSADAFNSEVTLILITVSYIVGLFLGHMAVKKGKQNALKQSGRINT